MINELSQPRYEFNFLEEEFIYLKVSMIDKLSQPRHEFALFRGSLYF